MRASIPQLLAFEDISNLILTDSVPPEGMLGHPPDAMLNVVVPVPPMVPANVAGVPPAVLEIVRVRPPDTFNVAPEAIVVEARVRSVVLKVVSPPEIHSPESAPPPTNVAPVPLMVRVLDELAVELSVTLLDALTLSASVMVPESVRFPNELFAVVSVFVVPFMVKRLVDDAKYLPDVKVTLSDAVHAPVPLHICSVPAPPPVKSRMPARLTVGLFVAASSVKLPVPFALRSNPPEIVCVPARSVVVPNAPLPYTSTVPSYVRAGIEIVASVASKRTPELNVPPVPSVEFWMVVVPRPEIVPSNTMVPALVDVAKSPLFIESVSPEATVKVPVVVALRLTIVIVPALEGSIVRLLNVVLAISERVIPVIKTVPELFAKSDLLKKCPATVRFVDGAVTVPVEVAMKKLVVEAAFAPNVFVPAPDNSTSSKADVPIIVPESVCAPAPLNVVVPEL